VSSFDSIERRLVPPFCQLFVNVDAAPGPSDAAISSLESYRHRNGRFPGNACRRLSLVPAATPGGPRWLERLRPPRTRDGRVDERQLLDATDVKERVQDVVCGGQATHGQPDGSRRAQMLLAKRHALSAPHRGHHDRDPRTLRSNLPEANRAHQAEPQRVAESRSIAERVLDDRSPQGHRAHDRRSASSPEELDLAGGVYAAGAVESRRVPWGIRRRESRLKGAGVGPHRVPTKSRPPVTWFGLRHVFVLVEMTDARLRLPSRGCARQRERRTSPHGR
jgi:hypothetical protein